MKTIDHFWLSLICFLKDQIPSISIYFLTNSLVLWQTKKGVFLKKA